MSEHEKRSRCLYSLSLTTIRIPTQGAARLARPSQLLAHIDDSPVSTSPRQQITVPSVAQHLVNDAGAAILRDRCRRRERVERRRSGGCHHWCVSAIHPHAVQPHTYLNHARSRASNRWPISLVLALPFRYPQTAGCCRCRRPTILLAICATTRAISPRKAQYTKRNCKLYIWEVKDDAQLTHVVQPPTVVSLDSSARQ